MQDDDRTPAEFFADMAADSAARGQTRANQREYVSTTPEHEGMIIPYNMPSEFHPSEYVGNYEITKGDYYGVKYTHEPRHVPGNAFMQSYSNLETMPERENDFSGFETLEETVAAIHKHKLDTKNMAGGIYLTDRGGWRVLHKRHWELTQDRIPWTEAEQAYYRDGADPEIGR